MRIAVYAFDDITMFHLAAPLMVFGEVDRLGLADDGQTRLWSDQAGTIRTIEGYPTTHPSRRTAHRRPTRRSGTDEQTQLRPPLSPILRNDPGTLDTRTPPAARAGTTRNNRLGSRHHRREMRLREQRHPPAAVYGSIRHLPHRVSPAIRRHARQHHRRDTNVRSMGLIQTASPVAAVPLRQLGRSYVLSPTAAPKLDAHKIGQCPNMAVLTTRYGAAGSVAHRLGVDLSKGSEP